jgi:hypothetical protein
MATLAEIAPNLYKTVPKKVVRSRTVAKALNNRVWVSDIHGALTVPVLMDYLRIWDLLDRVSRNRPNYKSTSKKKNNHRSD